MGGEGGEMGWSRKYVVYGEWYNFEKYWWFVLGLRFDCDVGEIFGIVDNIWEFVFVVVLVFVGIVVLYLVLYYRVSVEFLKNKKN